MFNSQNILSAIYLLLSLYISLIRHSLYFCICNFVFLSITMIHNLRPATEVREETCGQG